MRIPVAVSPMAFVMDSNAALSLAVSRAGGLGAVASASLEVGQVRDAVNRALSTADRQSLIQLNVWLPISIELERVLLSDYGVDRGRVVLSTIFGLWSAPRLKRLRAAGFHSWWAQVATADEAVLAEQAGADVVVLQSANAGGHRATLFPDVPGVAESARADLKSALQRVKVPIVAAGGIACGRSMAEALSMGAVAVQCGSVFLRSPEAALAPSFAAALGTAAGNTVPTRLYSGRVARAVASTLPALSEPLLPYPEQRAKMQARGIVAHMAGTEAYRSEARGAETIAEQMWRDCQQIMKVKS